MLAKKNLIHRRNSVICKRDRGVSQPARFPNRCRRFAAKPRFRCAHMVCCAAEDHAYILVRHARLNLLVTGKRNFVSRRSRRCWRNSCRHLHDDDLWRQWLRNGGWDNGGANPRRRNGSTWHIKTKATGGRGWQRINESGSAAWLRRFSFQVHALTTTSAIGLGFNRAVWKFDDRVARWTANVNRHYSYPVLAGQGLATAPPAPAFPEELGSQARSGLSCQGAHASALPAQQSDLESQSSFLGDACQLVLSSLPLLPF
jgi:hypothetical protein